MISITILLPIYNEAPHLENLLTRLAEALPGLPSGCKILCVDDGSIDGSSDVLSSFLPSLPIQVLRQKDNRGLGSALRVGIRHFLEQAPDDGVLVVMDADNTHSPLYIKPLLEGLNGRDLVIASRFQPGSRQVGVPRYRRLLSLAGSICGRILRPIPGVRDYTCGFRAYRARALRTLRARFGEPLPRQSDFSSVLELLVKLRAIGADMTEIPFELRYDFKRTPSKLNVIKGIVKAIRILLTRS